MPKINILPKSVADLIAAGEVVERPASAVKELVENAIDAGAKKITVEIRNGGVLYMRVTDDGCGIASEDVPKAFISHATSKIAEAQDLDAILTLGFRGEALASIAAVARVEMLTKTSDAQFGARYVIEGGKEISADTAGCPDGTTIVVRDLFYNTPARMKFLKRDATEAAYVSDAVAKIALAHPEICFRLIRDGKQTLFTPGDGKSASVLSALFGREFRESVIPCEGENDGVRVAGWVSLPRRCKPTRSSQHFYVNSRPVKIPVGAAALDNAYKNSAMTGKFPACVLNIIVPAGTVDVNVHPAKTEVRFSDEKRIYNAIYYAVKNAIGEMDSRPALSLDALLDTPAPLTGEQTEMATPSAPKALETGGKTALDEVGAVPFNERLMPPKPPKVTVYAPGDGSFSLAASPDRQEDDVPPP
ncbi:MAG: DNA mismatch repair endonuclease MutL, partial [Clostridia bacterium]|nr:DNA mismatch repair endonuclease MutL [Clostridia bacterium]